MANLYLTHKCNRACPFCFARKVLKDGGGNVDELLTVEEIKTLLSHFSGQFHEIGLLGGEPFLYPYFGEVLALLWQQNISPKIFTSATNPVPEKLKDLDITKYPVKFVVNTATRDSYSEEKYENLTAFLSKFHAVASLSYTLFDLDADTSFLFDIIDRFQLLSRSIRVGVALPIYKGGNQYIDKKDYPGLGKFFVNFAKMAYKRNVILGMDCGFVACMFTPTEIGTLQACGVRFSFTCGAVIDIGPKLKAWNCFPLFQLHSENVLESKNMNELVRKFNKTMDAYFNSQTGIFPQCVDCKYFKRRVCQGGCKSLKSV
ncbi:MAG: radical SAM protein [Dysgonamonadaceae bacterium]|jgi:radical SAM protein with 4Fe4S-binding SPASM domain|nr:radical SAM protein [Dysgonamonadaceae bacterium]